MNSIKRFAIRIFLSLVVVMMFFLVSNHDVSKATVTTPELSLSKYAYSETSNELEIAIRAKKGSTIKEFILSLDYDTEQIEWIPYNSNYNIWINEIDGLKLSEDYDCDGGVINISSICLDEAQTLSADTTLCLIKFKILGEGNILEENLPNDIFGNYVLEVSNDEEAYDGTLEIGNMPKYAESIEVVGISMDKETYKHGEVANYVSGKVIINYTNCATSKGKSREVDLSTLTDTNGISIKIEKNGDWIANYNNPYVTFKYKSIISGPVQINVIDWIENIRFEAPTQKTYYYGEELNLAGAKICIKRASQTQEETMDLIDLIEANKATINGFDSTVGKKQIINQTVNVSVDLPEYGFSADDLKFVVTIIDRIEKIEWITKPSKTTYLYNEQLDTTNGKIRAIYTSKETEEPIVVTEDMVTELDGSLFNSTKIGTRDLEVTYTYEENGVTKNKILNYEIKVNDQIEKVEWITKPTKKIYICNEDLDTTGGEIKVTYISGKTEEVTVTEDMVTELDGSLFNSTKIGTRDLQVTYTYEENGVSKSKTLNYEIKINDQVEKIEWITKPTKKEYICKQDLNTTGGKIKVVYISGKTEEVTVTEDMVTELDGSPFNSTKIGTRDLQVTYTYKENDVSKSKTLNYEIIVYDAVEKIEWITEPTKKTYLYNEELDTTGGKIKVIYASGKTEEVTVTKAMVTELDGSPFNNTKIGTRDLQATYIYKENGVSKSKTLNYKINIYDVVEKIEWITEPTQKTYLYNEELNTAGGKIKVIYASGKTAEVTVTNNMVKEMDGNNFDKEAIGERNLQVIYMYEENNVSKSKILNYEITTSDYAVDIILVKPTKTTYLTKEQLDLTGATVQIIMASGKLQEAVPVTMDMIEGYKLNKLGAQKITVNYQGFQKNFEIIRTAQTGIEGIYIPEILINIILITILTMGIVCIIKKERGAK